MPSSAKRHTSTRTLRYVFLGIWLAILAATLWPFNPFPRNEVAWLPDANGLRFRPGSIVKSSGIFPALSASDQQACSVEVLVRPQNDTDVRTFLGFYVPGQHPLGFELRQYGQILLIVHSVRGPRGHVWVPEIDVEHVFQHGRSMLITIVSGTRGTTVYLNGELAMWVPGYRLPLNSLSGELILGGEAVGYDPWSGDISALAFYDQELRAPQVREHFTAWSTAGTLPNSELQNAFAAYSFAERGGFVVHNIAEFPSRAKQQGNAGAAPLSNRDNAVAKAAPDLLIPVHFRLPHQAFLTPPWRELAPKWIYIDDLVRNIVGFMPLGIAAYLYFLRLRGARQALRLTILVGFLTSLGIEILQAFIPQRVSGMTDIITNTTGTALGVFVLQAPPIRVMLPSMGILENGGDEFSRGQA